MAVWVLVYGCGTRYIVEGVCVYMNVGIWVWPRVCRFDIIFSDHLVHFTN